MSLKSCFHNMLPCPCFCDSLASHSLTKVRYMSSIWGAVLGVVRQQRTNSKRSPATQLYSNANSFMCIMCTKHGSLPHSPTLTRTKDLRVMFIFFLAHYALYKGKYNGICGGTNVIGILLLTPKVTEVHEGNIRPPIPSNFVSHFKN